MSASNTSLDSEIDLRAFHEGRESVIRRIYLDYGATLLRETARHVGAVEAECVVHDVFVELLRNRELRERFLGGALGAWLRQIARLKALEHLRRAGRRAAAFACDVTESPEPGLEARDALGRFVATCVPDAQRQFFALRFLEHRTQVEIAAELRIPRSTLEGWEHRLAQKLRAFIVRST